MIDDGDGKITPAELRHGLDKFGCRMTENDFDDLLNR